MKKFIISLLIIFQMSATSVLAGEFKDFNGYTIKKSNISYIMKNSKKYICVKYEKGYVFVKYQTQEERDAGYEEMLEWINEK